MAVCPAIALILAAASEAAQLSTSQCPPPAPAVRIALTATTAVTAVSAARTVSLLCRKSSKYKTPSVPFPFDSKDTYERAMRQPLGREYNTGALLVR